MSELGVLPDEQERLACLQSLGLLDQPLDGRFDRITRVTQRMFDAPVAVISLVDAQREWFLSCQGLVLSEVPRSVSFGVHTILADGLFVIADAAADARVARHPLVRGWVGVRFYAGCPLRGPGGHKVGTLCIMDTQARGGNEHQWAALQDLAAWAETELIAAAPTNAIHHELRRAMAATEAAGRARTAFLANMSHEMRTPLNAIIGLSELLQEEVRDAGQVNYLSDLERIQFAGKRMLALINDLLDLSKLESGKSALAQQRFVVADVIAEVATLAQPLIKDNTNRLVLNIDAYVGTMRGDVPKLRQMLLNLLSNAARFTERGTITVSAGRERGPGGGWVRFAVADTGMGMQAEQVATLFTEFQPPGGAPVPTASGTGLGLALTQQLCRSMGGEIAVESTPGGGSTFTFRLPVDGVPADPLL
ncbi:MAG TPA: GAF domain-containing sensor histidine kinase [Chloroflexia bacterium]|nr:GAF domain-containing sensor histidine kinase [Chloroflexia bacterium]